MFDYYLYYVLAYSVLAIFTQFMVHFASVYHAPFCLRFVHNIYFKL